MSNQITNSEYNAGAESQEREVYFDEERTPKLENASMDSALVLCLKKFAMFDFIEHGSILSSVITLGKMTLGAGILGMPSAFNEAGVIPFIIFLLFSCAANIYTFRLLGIAADKTGLKSFEELSRSLGGIAFDWATSIVMWAVTYGTCVLFLVALKDVLNPIRSLSGVPDIFQGEYGIMLLITLFFVVIIFPLSLPLNINTLRYTSFIGVLMVAYLVVTLIINATKSPQTSVDHIKLTSSGLSLARTIGIAIYSYCSQTNALEIYAEMKKPNAPRLTWAALFSQSGAAVFYVVAGMVGYATYSSPDGNILNNLDPLRYAYITVTFIMVAVNLTVTFPVSLFPARDTVIRRLGYTIVYNTPSHVRMFVSGMLALSALVIAFWIPKIDILFGLVGSLSGSCISFIWPPIFVIATGEWTVEKVGWTDVIASWSVLFIGILVGISGTADSIYSIIQSS